eukprot:gb/GECH01004618.1/.p1 GENE.gb/GECH01004618.1/~~gb/GECH01004618.1/.p1  ORF type:complete len:361 (+),score=92.42 gb/GECH01004618.1/:1-1083(+)
MHPRSRPTLTYFRTTTKNNRSNSDTSKRNKNNYQLSLKDWKQKFMGNIHEAEVDLLYVTGGKEEEVNIIKEKMENLKNGVVELMDSLNDWVSRIFEQNQKGDSSTTKYYRERETTLEKMESELTKEKHLRILETEKRRQLQKYVIKLRDDLDQQRKDMLRTVHQQDFLRSQSIMKNVNNPPKTTEIIEKQEKPKKVDVATSVSDFGNTQEKQITKSSFLSDQERQEIPSNEKNAAGKEKNQKQIESDIKESQGNDTLDQSNTKGNDETQNTQNSELISPESEMRENPQEIESDSHCTTQNTDHSQEDKNKELDHEKTSDNSSQQKLEQESDKKSSEPNYQPSSRLAAIRERLEKRRMSGN